MAAATASNDLNETKTGERCLRQGDDAPNITTNTTPIDGPSPQPHRSSMAVFNMAAPGFIVDRHDDRVAAGMQQLSVAMHMAVTEWQHRRMEKEGGVCAAS